MPTESALSSPKAQRTDYADGSTPHSHALDFSWRFAVETVKVRFLAQNAIGGVRTLRVQVLSADAAVRPSRQSEAETIQHTQWGWACNSLYVGCACWYDWNSFRRPHAPS
jgi:hypothetical protein